MADPSSRSPFLQTVLSQRWWDLCFLHWRVDPDALQSVLPAELSVDTFGAGDEEQASWLGIVTFRLDDTRPLGWLPIPHEGAFAELNVRTYVRGPHGEPAVFFFSLDGPRLLTNWIGRSLFGVPYLRAYTALKKNHDQLVFESNRPSDGAQTKLKATFGANLGEAAPGTMEHFLTERYRYYSALRGRLWSGAVSHEHYKLRGLCVDRWESSHASALGLPTGKIEHACYCPGVMSEFSRPEVLRQLPHLQRELC